MRKIDNCVYALIGRKGIQTAQRLPQPQNFAVVSPSVLNRYEAKANFLKNAANENITKSVKELASKAALKAY